MGATLWWVLNRVMLILVGWFHHVRIPGRLTKPWLNKLNGIKQPLRDWQEAAVVCWLQRSCAHLGVGCQSGVDVVHCVVQLPGSCQGCGSGHPAAGGVVELKRLGVPAPPRPSQQRVRRVARGLVKQLVPMCATRLSQNSWDSRQPASAESEG
jgi:hypothetical protein